MTSPTHHSGIDINTAMLIRHKRWQYLTTRIETYIPTLENSTHLNIDVQLYLYVPQLPDTNTSHTQATPRTPPESSIKRAFLKLARVTVRLANPILRPFITVLSDQIMTQLREQLTHELHRKLIDKTSKIDMISTTTTL